MSGLASWHESSVVIGSQVTNHIAAILNEKLWIRHENCSGSEEYVNNNFILICLLQI